MLDCRVCDAAVAQPVEQRIRNAWVGGSSPFCGTTGNRVLPAVIKFGSSTSHPVMALPIFSRLSRIPQRQQRRKSNDKTGPHATIRQSGRPAAQIPFPVRRCMAHLPQCNGSRSSGKSARRAANSLSHNSTAIEGNLLSLVESRVLLTTEISICGRPVHEYWEVGGQAEALDYHWTLIGPDIRRVGLFALNTLAAGVRTFGHRVVRSAAMHRVLEVEPFSYGQSSASTNSLILCSPLRHPIIRLELIPACAGVADERAHEQRQGEADHAPDRKTTPKSYRHSDRETAETHALP